MAMGSNPVEALKFFSGLNLQLLKLRLQLRWSNLYFKYILDYDEDFGHHNRVYLDSEDEVDSEIDTIYYTDDEDSDYFDPFESEDYIEW